MNSLLLNFDEEKGRFVVYNKLIFGEIEKIVIFFSSPFGKLLG